jgi:hypothetical protein
MNMQVIIYKDDDGRVATIYPMPDALETLGLNLIALKDVPAGKPYKVINQSELPDRENRESLWDVDDADLTDGVGAPLGAGTDDVVIGYDLVNGIVALRNEVSGELKAYNINTQQFVEVVE